MTLTAGYDLFMASDDDPMEAMAKTFAELDEQHARVTAELDERDRLVAEADAEYQRQVKADAAALRAMALNNVRVAAELAADGYEPSWDWRAAIVEWGFTDEEIHG